MMRPVTQADFVEQRPRAVAGFGDAHDLHRREDVFVGRERGYQMERLKDEAYQPAAQLGQFVFVHSGDLAPAETDAARSRRVESGDQAEQSRFAAARRADDRDELTAWYVQIQRVQDGQSLRPARDNFGDICELNHVIFVPVFSDAALCITASNMRKLPQRANFFSASAVGRYCKSLFDCVPKFSARVGKFLA